MILQFSEGVPERSMYLLYADFQAFTCVYYTHIKTTCQDLRCAGLNMNLAGQSYGFGVGPGKVPSELPILPDQSEFSEGCLGSEEGGTRRSSD